MRQHDGRDWASKHKRSDLKLIHHCAPTLPFWRENLICREISGGFLRSWFELVGSWINMSTEYAFISHVCFVIKTSLSAAVSSVSKSNNHDLRELSWHVVVVVVVFNLLWKHDGLPNLLPLYRVSSFCFNILVCVVSVRKPSTTLDAPSIS